MGMLCDPTMTTGSSRWPRVQSWRRIKWRQTCFACCLALSGGKFRPILGVDRGVWHGSSLMHFQVNVWASCDQETTKKRETDIVNWYLPLNDSNPVRSYHRHKVIHLLRIRGYNESGVTLNTSVLNSEDKPLSTPQTSLVPLCISFVCICEGPPKRAAETNNGTSVSRARPSLLRRWNRIREARTLWMTSCSLNAVSSKLAANGSSIGDIRIKHVCKANLQPSNRR